jgi:hypothetical protein
MIGDLPDIARIGLVAKPHLDVCGAEVKNNPGTLSPRGEREMALKVILAFLPAQGYGVV